MVRELSKTSLFCDYYSQWIQVYKEGAVRPVTLNKYKMTLSWLKKLAPGLKLCDVSRVEYQQILNAYAVYHERQTTMDFHHQLKGAVWIDAVELLGEIPPELSHINWENSPVKLELNIKIVE